MKITEKEEAYQSMVVSVLQTAQVLDHEISAILVDANITHPQFNILRLLEQMKPTPMSVGAVKEKILFKKSDITRLIDRLVDKRLVKRKLCTSNRRKMDITLTDLGQHKIDEVLPLISKRLKGYFEQSISEKEKDTLLDILNRIREEI